MLYVPIKIYPNQRSVRGCLVLAGVSLGLALVGFHYLEDNYLKLAVYSACMVGFVVSMINGMVVTSRQPMIKVLDDRFSVYTPFGYAVVRFGEVLKFRKGGVPLFRTLRVEINRSASPRFTSPLNRLMYDTIWLNFANSLSIRGFMLGADLESVIQMLEKRRLAAVRFECADNQAPVSLTEAG